MNELINSLILLVVEALRRLWQRLTGREPKPVPVPIAIRRSAIAGRTLHSRTLFELRCPYDERRHRGRR